METLFFPPFNFTTYTHTCTHTHTHTAYAPVQPLGCGIGLEEVAAVGVKIALEDMARHKANG